MLLYHLEILYQFIRQARKAGVKTPQVLKLGSLLTTLRLSSMSKKTKGILGKEFKMPYAEIHMGSGFGLDDVRSIGVSNEFKDRVAEAISSMEVLLANAGKSDIPVYDIIGKGKNALAEIGETIPKALPKESSRKSFTEIISNLKKPKKPQKLQKISQWQQNALNARKVFEETMKNPGIMTNRSMRSVMNIFKRRYG